MQIIPASYNNSATRIKIPDLPPEIIPASPDGPQHPAPPSGYQTPLPGLGSVIGSPHLNPSAPVPHEQSNSYVGIGGLGSPRSPQLRSKSGTLTPDRLGGTNTGLAMRENALSAALQAQNSSNTKSSRRSSVNADSSGVKTPEEQEKDISIRIHDVV